MGFEVNNVRTARKYVVLGEINQKQTELITKKILANDCIEVCVIGSESEPPSPHVKPYELKLVHWPIRDLDDEGLLRLSKEKDLFLNVIEMKTIQNYYRGLDREPTDIELEAIAQTWSEHCVHKTLKSEIDMDCDGKQIHFDNMLKETVFKATQELNKPWCISVFADNAGVIEFDDESAVCFKVETHNHPSALDPYGGAATGIGGVIRDPMGTGLGARPIANTDIFCFGDPNMKPENIPRGVLHPRRIMKGVVAGVRDYGNRMGIPTVNGAIYFDERYTANPLVFCGNIGIMDKNKCFKHPQTGNLIIVVGGRTGRDGIHGATFSSGEMTHQHETIFSHAVQIGNAITEKKMLDVLVQANDRNLYEAITDCGAGGLSSAVGEMGEHLGAEVHIDKAPLKYEGLSYSEIWVSEAQERMVLAVPPRHRARIAKLFKAENVEATFIGRFTGDKRLRLFYRKRLVGELDMGFLHDGVPRLVRRAEWKRQRNIEPRLKERKNYGPALKKILGAWNVCSKEWIIRQYDHEVQGWSVLKPLVGVENDGPGDAAVIAPVLGSNKGLAISNGINPKYGDVDPYAMAASAIDEAVRQIVAVGGSPDRIALLDNFCWGNTNKPDRLGSLVLAARACYDVAKAYGTPFISGKDSLNNEFRVGDRSIAIPPTLLISAIGIVPDVRKCVSMDAKAAGNIVYVVGRTYDEMGGSHYYAVRNLIGNTAPVVRPREGLAVFRAMAAATKTGLMRSCHDCSEGGIAVAAAEMAFAGGLGMDLYTVTVPRPDDLQRDDVILFSESNSRFLCEVEPDKADAFEKALGAVPFAPFGRVTEDGVFRVRGLRGKAIVREAVASLKEAWKKPLAY